MNFIRKYWIKIISIGLGLLIATSLIQYSQNNHLNSRIDTLNNNFKRLATKDSTLLKDIKYQQFKEDSYIKQVDRDTNLTLWFVAIMFGVFGIISFASFNIRVEQIEKVLDEKYDEHISELNNLKDDVNELKADLNSDSATLYSEKADKFKRESKNDMYVFYELLSIRKQALTYEYHRSRNKTLSESIRESMNANLKVLDYSITKFENKPSIDKKSFDRISDSIRKVDNTDLNLLVSKIHVNLNLTDEKII